MLTPELLATLEPGTQIEAGAMFPGLCDEPIVWEVSAVNTKARTWGFLVYWQGVFLTTYTATITDDGEVKYKEI